jgi:nicotinamidase-related amidase
MKKVITTIVSVILIGAVLAFLFAPLFNGCSNNLNTNKDMRKKILILVDVQNDFIDGSLRNEEAIKTVPNIVDYINNFDGDAIYATKDTHDENYLNTPEGKKLPVVHCIENTEGWQINNDVYGALVKAMDRGVDLCFIEKPTFGSYELIDTLKQDLNADTIDIDICGFCTDICVVSNALLVKAAFYDKANITVLKDLCAGVTPESHEAALTTMQMCQIDIR